MKNQYKQAIALELGAIKAPEKFGVAFVQKTSENYLQNRFF
jgi:hypothetical protein